MKHEITAKNVVDFYSELESMGIQIWLDGGWGVDALLGEQSRLHEDLDIIVQKKDAATIRKYLEDRGYTIIPRDDLSDINFHMADYKGHEVDFIVIEFDEEGNGIYGPKENGEMNPADSFKGEGTINGHKVRCVAPEYAVQFKTGYLLKEKDYHDIAALCKKFNIEYPREHNERMIPQLLEFLSKTEDVKKVVIGSLNLFLQGINLPVSDVDVMTNDEGVEKVSSTFNTDIFERRVFKTCEFVLQDIDFEVGSCKGNELRSCDFMDNLTWVKVSGVNVPCLSLESELDFYERAGREKDIKKAEIIKRALKGVD